MHYSSAISARRFAPRFGAMVYALASANAVLAAAPPNPTASDARGNTAGGTGALSALTGSGYGNSAFGYAALNSNTTGYVNTASGNSALGSNTTGYGNSAFGVSSLRSNTTGFNNTANGANSLSFNTTGYDNAANGMGALYSNTTGTYNTANGAHALSRNTTGRANTAIGNSTLLSNTIASWNTAVGGNALYSNTSGEWNAAFGGNVLYANTTGNYNAAFGTDAMQTNTTGSYNAVVGLYALQANTTGSYNTGLGANALYAGKSASNSVALGYNALSKVTTGGTNIAVGSGAGQTLTTGSGNILIGHAGGSAGEAKTTRIGTAQTRAFIAGIRGVKTGVADAVTVMIDSKGQLGTVKSSARYKEDIHDMAAYSSRLYQLRPVTYRYKEPAEDGQKPLEPGLVAEEVAKVYPDLVVRNAAGQIETVQYHKLAPMLLNEMQALAARNTALEEEVRHLKMTLDERLARLEAAQTSIAMVAR